MDGDVIDSVATLCDRINDFFVNLTQEFVPLTPDDVAGIAVESTAISRKFVKNKVHATIPKCNMGYDQYTVSNDCSCRTYFCYFPSALANIYQWPPRRTILLNFFEKQCT